MCAAHRDEQLIAPRYGIDSLADLVPSALHALGVTSLPDRLHLDLAGVRRICLLLIDGLGARLLARNSELAPLLGSVEIRTLTAGFPSTTATSLSSLGTGLPPGQHGIVGYLTALPGRERLMNPLSWHTHGPGPHVDLLKELPPEHFQPYPTAFETAAEAGVRVVGVGPRHIRDSGLSRASLRYREFRPAVSIGDLTGETIAALTVATGPTLVYSYFGELDLTGHVRGPDSPAWRAELAHVDRLVADIAAQLPSDAALLVTADHGMVTVRNPIDLDAEEDLRRGVALIGGEPRARHVYTEPDAADAVHATWTARLGDDFAVLHRDEALELGWFGPTVEPHARERIGDLVAVARTDRALIRRHAEPNQSALIGHHGSLTADEMEVPLAVLRR